DGADHRRVGDPHLARAVAGEGPRIGEVHGRAHAVDKAAAARPAGDEVEPRPRRRDAHTGARRRLRLVAATDDASDGAGQKSDGDGAPHAGQCTTRYFNVRVTSTWSARQRMSRVP